MAEYLFPFDRVEKGSDIVIYGMGFVGRQYLEQVRASGYCNVAALVDRDAARFAQTKYHVVTLDDLSQYTFDYIVVAAVFSDTAKSIMQDLQQRMDIPPEKVICARAERIRSSFSLHGLEHMLSGYERLSACLESFLYEAYGNIHYFDEVIEELKSDLYLNPGKCNREKEYLKGYLAWETSARKKIILVRILYEAGCLDKDCAETMMNCIGEFRDDYESRIWLTWDMSIMELENSHIRYDNYFLDKRRVMRENMEHFVDGANFVKGEKDPEGKKIAVIGFHFDNVAMSHFKFTQPVVNELCGMGYKVTIFPIDLLRYSYGECFMEPILPVVKDSSLMEQKHRQLLAPGIDIVYPRGCTIRERLNHFTGEIYRYNPDVVLDFCGEYAFCSSIYYDAFPTVALPMRGYASSAWFDKYVARDRQMCVEENKVFRSVPLDKMEICLPIHDTKYLDSISQPFDREKFGFDQNDFLIVTSGDRLKNELTIEFVDCVCSFIKRHNNVKWLLVGQEICEYIKVRYKNFLTDGDVVIWGYERDLSGLYGMCDIFWNPNRNGAGGCISLAMQCGLPVVTTTFPSDILSVLGKENAVNGGYAECAEYAERLYSDKDLRLLKSKLMQVVFCANVGNTENYAEKLLEVGLGIKKVFEACVPENG